MTLLDKKKIKILRKKYQLHAKKNGFRLNPNKELVDQLLIALIKIKKKYGKAYCPCRRIKNNPEQDKNNICPCIHHKKEILEQEHCHCFLFVK